MTTIKKLFTTLVCTTLLGAFASVASAAEPVIGPKLFKQFKFGMPLDAVTQVDSSIKPCSELFPADGFPSNAYCKYPQKFLDHDWLCVYVFEEPIGLMAVRLISTEDYSTELFTDLSNKLSDYVPLSLTIGSETTIMLDKPIEEVLTIYAEKRLKLFQTDELFMLELFPKKDFVAAQALAKRSENPLQGFAQYLAKNRTVKMYRNPADGTFGLFFEADALYAAFKQLQREEF